MDYSKDMETRVKKLELDSICYRAEIDALIESLVASNIVTNLLVEEFHAQKDSRYCSRIG
jgi:hypothetical protein